MGWGAELAARAVEAGISDLKVRRVAALDLPIANAKSLDDAILPSHEAVTRAAVSLVS